MTTTTTQDSTAATRSFLLRMGNAWLEQGELRQAVDVYLKIIYQYADSPESQNAQNALLNIVQRYEQQGKLRLSLDILERLEQTQDA